MSSDLIISPVGRWFFGSMTDKVKTDYQRRPIPEEKQQYTIGVAFRKDDPAVGQMLQAMATAAMQDYAQAPHIQQMIGQYNFTPKSGFSWKVKDGDQPNAQGQFNENTRGCYEVYFSSSYVTKCADPQNAEIANTAIERGAFIRVCFTVTGNGNVDATAGIYVNPQIYQFVAYGEPIRGGVDAATAFAGHALPQQLPPGASHTPLAAGPMATGQPAAPGAPAPGQPMQQGAPAAPMGGTPAPGMMPQVTTPAPGMTPQAGMPGVQPDPNAMQPGFVPPATPQGLPPGSPMTQQNAPLTTGYPTDPNAGVQPNPNFANGPQPGMQPAAPMGQPGMVQPGMQPGQPVQ